MSQLNWWEQVSPDNDANNDGIPDDNVVTDPIREAHYAQLNTALQAFTDELQKSLMERLKHLYVQKNHNTTVTLDNFMGMGLAHPGQFQTILVDEAAMRLKQVYQQHMHGMYIPQYRVGEILIEMCTGREFRVDTAPNRTAAMKDHGFVYHLTAMDTNLQEIRSAEVVECTHFVRKHLADLPEGTCVPMGTTVQSMDVPEHCGHSDCHTGSCCHGSTGVPYNYNHCHDGTCTTCNHTHCTCNSSN